MNGAENECFFNKHENALIEIKVRDNKAERRKMLKDKIALPIVSAVAEAIIGGVAVELIMA